MLLSGGAQGAEGGLGSSPHAELQSQRWPVHSPTAQPEVAITRASVNLEVQSLADSGQERRQMLPFAQGIETAVPSHRSALIQTSIARAQLR